MNSPMKIVGNLHHINYLSDGTIMTEYNTFIDYKANDFSGTGLISIGGILNKRQKITIISTFSVGFQQKIISIISKDYVFEKRYINYSTGPRNEESTYKASNLIYYNNNGLTTFFGLGCKIRYKVTDRISIDLESGLKIYKIPRYKISIATSRNEFFSLLSINRVISPKNKELHKE